MIHHINIEVRGRLAIAPTEALRRQLVRVVVRVLGPRLIVFSLVDEHVHFVLRGPQARAAAATLRAALGACVPELTLEEPFLRVVTTRAHLRWCVGYVLTQVEHHDLPVHPALWTGSCFQDLIGARRLRGFDARPLREELPKTRLRDLLSIVGLEPTPLLPVEERELVGVGPAHLIDLAGAALGVGPALVGCARPVVQARALALHAARYAGVPMSTMAQ